MDFDLIVFLLIFLFPLFQRLFGKKKPAPNTKRVRSERDSAPSEQIEDPLGEALRQIREALGDQTQPATQPEQPRPLPENPKPVTERPEEFRRTEEFRELGEFEHEAHGFGRENPLSEEVFEQRPAFQTRGSTQRIRQKSLGEVDLTTPLEVKASTESADSSHSDLKRLLRNPERARDAFVLKEILDAPRSRRPLR